MSAQSFETTLVRLYTDPKFRNSFLENPEVTLEDCDLTPSEKVDLIAIDRAGLLMASHSFHYKRRKRIHRNPSRRVTIFLSKIIDHLKDIT